MENNIKLKTILNPQLAKYLVNKNFTIKDLKPNRNIGKEGQTVFCFELTNELLEAIKSFENKK